MQIPLRTESSTEAYIAGCEWRDAFLCVCPMHPSGGCSFVRHGSYSRVTPQGLRYGLRVGTVPKVTEHSA